MGLATAADLVEGGLFLIARCAHCARAVDLDQLALPPSTEVFGRRWRCRRCGQLGGVTIGWLTPPEALRRGR